MARRFYVFLISLMLVMGVATRTHAGALEDAVTANKAGDYATARKLMEPLAEAGDRSAQFGMGQLFYEGHGVAVDDQQAMKWYKLAAAQGSAAAQFMLGLMAGDGRGMPKDDVAALKWYRSAAELGDSEAQYVLGVCYDVGRGTPKDDVEAVKWFHKSAVQGYAQAQFSLGVMYRIGAGVKADKILARMWFLLGQSNGADDPQHWTELSAQGLSDVELKQATVAAGDCYLSNYENCD